MHPQTRITTERLLLRRPHPGDGAAIFRQWTQDEEVTRYLVWSPHTRAEDSEGFVTKAIGDWDKGASFTYFICRLGGDELIGCVSVRPDKWIANLGFLLAKPYWGQGYMPEVLRALLDWVFSDPQMYRATAICHVDNKASARAMEKADMVREGRIARLASFPNISEEPCDCFMYAKVR